MGPKIALGQAPAAERPESGASAPGPGWVQCASPRQRTHGRRRLAPGSGHPSPGARSAVARPSV